MIPWVILLRMHIFSALCDPWGSCDDKDQSVAGGEAAWGRSGGGGSPTQHWRGAIIPWSYHSRNATKAQFGRK